MKKQNSTAKTVIGLVILAVAVLVIFILAINTPDKNADTVKITAATKQLTKNYAKDYPATPKAVVTEYAEITKCFYDPETNEDQITGLATQMRHSDFPQIGDRDLQERGEAHIQLLSLFQHGCEAGDQ